MQRLSFFQYKNILCTNPKLAGQQEVGKEK